MIYGAMHSGLETKLKRSWISDATIWFYHDLLGYMKKKDLNEVREIELGDYGVLYSKIHNCNLF